MSQPAAQKKAEAQARMQQAVENVSTRTGAATRNNIVTPTVDKPKATPATITQPPTVDKPKISSPMSAFESIFEKFIGNKNKLDDVAKINNATAPVIDRDKINNATKINDVAEPSINRTKINDATTATVDSISNKLSDVNNTKAFEEDYNNEPNVEESNFEQQSNKVGLNDLNEQLIQLNTSIRQLIEHSAETVETASKQVRATKSLSGNRFA
jgi:hypothetical protein